MDYLSNVSFDKALRITEGLFVHNYKELVSELKILSDQEFREYLNGGVRVVNWIKENYNDERLLLKLEIANTRREFIRILEKRINSLECEKIEREKKEKVLSEKRKLPLYVNVLFFVAFALVIVSFMQYIFENDEDSWKNYLEQNSDLKIQLEKYSERIIYLEKQNIDLKSNLSLLNEQINSRNISFPSPKDRLSAKDIEVDGTRVLIRLNNAYIAEFADTGSMLPVLGFQATGIEIKPEKESDIYLGDIIGYKLENDVIVIHRVMEIGYDVEGWYAITKGDNNYFPDKNKVRFSQVEKVLVGIIY